MLRCMSPVLALNGGLFSAQITAGIEGAADLEWLAYPLTDPCQSDILQSGPASGNRMQSIEATRRAKSLPMTDFLHPWPPPSIRGPFAEVAHEAWYHQRGWQVARRNRARSPSIFLSGITKPPWFSEVPNDNSLRNEEGPSGGITEASSVSGFPESCRPNFDL